MAGLGEVCSRCSHVAAVLFLLEDWNRKSKNLNISATVSCTDVLSKWIVPSNKSIDMARVSNIKWSNKLQVDCVDPLPAWTHDEIDRFLHRIENAGTCHLMALREPFSKRFVTSKNSDVQSDERNDDTDIDLSNLFLTSLFNTASTTKTLEELQDLSKNIHLSWTDEQIIYIESNRRPQHQSKLWFQSRTGRVTGSTFKSVCRTAIESPSISLIDKIYYPEKSQFYSVYTEHGKKYEPKAQPEYEKQISKVHTNFTLSVSGFVVSKEFPHCGVSPDGLVSCDCCGKGCLEIKCPYLKRNSTLNAYLERKDCPLLKKDEDFSLDSKHDYYYQVQLQMFVLNVTYCDFTLWSSKQM